MIVALAAAGAAYRAWGKIAPDPVYDWQSPLWNPPDPWRPKGDKLNVSKSSPYEPLYKSIGREYDLDWRLLRAIAITESSEQPDAVSHADAYGLFQILARGDNDFPASRTWQSYRWLTLPDLRAKLLKDTRFNAQIGAEILRWNIDRYGTRKGIAVYNRWKSRLETEPFKNQDYLDKVWGYYQELLKV